MCKSDLGLLLRYPLLSLSLLSKTQGQPLGYVALRSITGLRSIVDKSRANKPYSKIMVTVLFEDERFKLLKL